MTKKIPKFFLRVCLGIVFAIIIGGALTMQAQALTPDRQPQNLGRPSNLRRPPEPIAPPQISPPAITPEIDEFAEQENDRAVQVANQNAVIYWDNITLDAIRNVRPGPPVVSRILAMVHTAQYEAWSQYDPIALGSLLGGRYRQPLEQNTLSNKTLAMSYAAYRILVDLFPDFANEFIGGARKYNIDVNNNTTSPDTPAGMGNLAATAVLTYRHNDGANQLGDRSPGAYSDYTNYQPVNSPDKISDLNAWQPLATANGSFQGGCVPGLGSLTLQTYVGAHWGLVTPFALNDGEAIAATIKPARYPSPEFTQQAQEILDISANLTDLQKAISEYWVDGPASELPPGHWALISQLVSQRRRHSLDDDAKLFFAVSNANLDAGILAWKIKREFVSVRPITAIRELFRGQKVRAWGGPGKGTELINGEDWEPYQDRCFVSPAFPEFISGHSTFSAASAEVLKSFTGSDHFPSVHTVNFLRLGRLEKPLKLQWHTFSEQADEAGMSRRYGGIHFAQGDLVGRDLGRKVGARVWTKAQELFAGR